MPPVELQFLPLVVLLILYLFHEAFFLYIFIFRTKLRF